jgi:hypothetical protein
VICSTSDATPLSSGAEGQESAITEPKLKIVIVEGDGAINNVRQRVSREVIVQVEDENRKPVAGAAVTFLLPVRGPGGMFAQGGTTLNVTTDSLGRAAATFNPNNLAGTFKVDVSASFQGQTTTTAVSQTNGLATAAAGSSGTSGTAGTAAGAGGAATAGGLSTLAIVGIVAGAAAAAVAIGVTQAGGKGNSAAPPAAAAPSARIGAPGAIVVGRPQ